MPSRNKIFSKKFYAIFIVAVCFLVILYLFIFSSMTCAVMAAETKEKNTGLTLSPIKMEIEVQPGTSEDKAITVTNNTGKEMTVNLRAEKFDVINENYDYSFSDDSNIIEWIRFGADQFYLKAGESKKVLFTLAVPEDEEPGGRYISIFASSDIESSKNNAISIKQRVGSLIYVTVLGKVTRTGKMISLNTPWVIGGESSWSMTLQNVGSTHFYSQYNISVESIIGRKKISTTSGDSMILPDSVRTITAKFPAPSIPGLYKTVYTIGLGDTPARIETRYVLYLPFWALMSLLLVIYLAYWFVTKKRKKNSNGSLVRRYIRRLLHNCQRVLAYLHLRRK